MALVCIRLITFRRPQLLARALASVQAQTFADWTCEVHNNDPADPEPERQVARLGDARFRVVNPAHRVGLVEAFNRALAPAGEPFQTVLEDDNWWEPTFLEKMLGVFRSYPAAQLVWCNLRLWQETAEGKWHATGRLAWQLPPASPVRIFHWPTLLQFDDSLHSNGAMLLRSQIAGDLVMPLHVPVDLPEQCRERMMAFPLHLLPEPLVNFALTRSTARSSDPSNWGAAQALLGAAYLAHVPLTSEAKAALWAHRRSTRPRSTNSLVYSALVQRDASFLRHATLADWMHFARGAARRPLGAWRTLRVRHRHAATDQWLRMQIAARTAEAKARGFAALTSDSLLDKQGPRNHGLSTT